MNVVMTGATGLVGQELGQELVRRGHKVRALIRDPGKPLSFDAEKFAWSGNEIAPPKAFENASALVHLAGENVAAARWTEARKRALFDSRIQSANYLAQAVRAQANAQALDVCLTASGIGYYGDRGEELLTENSGAGKDFLAELCVQWEGAARKIPAKRFVAARFGVVLKEGEGFLGKVAPLFKLLGASRLADGESYLAWVHIDDVTRLLADMVEQNGFKEAYNVCAPEPIKNKDMTKSLAKALNTWSAPPVPKFALKIMYGELSAALLGSQRAIPARLQDQNWKFKYADFKSALDRIFSPR